jgi:beta-lactamase regulating signal transducer with metallopeptidase domain
MDAIFLQVLNMSMIASYVILFVIALRLCLKKLPKIFSYALWSSILFRLICPVTFESLFSLLSMNTKPIPDNIQYAKLPQINSGINFIDSIANPILATHKAAPYASINPMQITILLGEFIWVTGIVALLLYSIISLINLHNRLIGAVRLQDNIYLVDHITTPFVIGVIHPKIYLPSTLLEQERKYIVLHEQTHIKRIDHVIKLIAFLTLAVHWFNPLVWIAFILFVKDMEMSCDESVMKQMNIDIRKEYSASLLSLASGKRIIAGTPLAFGEGDTKGRIKNILNYKRTPFWIVVVSTIAVAAICMGLIANPSEERSFYVTTRDGKTHTLGNNANTYLVIDGDSYNADYKWLSSWGYDRGNASLPEGFFEAKKC